MDWYVVQTHPRQEKRALLDLERQGYQCYLPMLSVKLNQQTELMLKHEPLFPRYLFIVFDTDLTVASLAPIHLTPSVSRLMTFRQKPVKVDPALINFLKINDKQFRANIDRLFDSGEHEELMGGAFAEIHPVYFITEGVKRSHALIQFLSKSMDITNKEVGLSKLG